MPGREQSDPADDPGLESAVRSGRRRRLACELLSAGWEYQSTGVNNFGLPRPPGRPRWRVFARIQAALDASVRIQFNQMLMLDANSTPQSDRPKRALPPPQFGLRMLLGMMTACAVLAALSQW